jgi:hypothetical protein
MHNAAEKDFGGIHEASLSTIATESGFSSAATYLSNSNQQQFTDLPGIAVRLHRCRRVARLDHVQGELGAVDNPRFNSR